MIDPRRCRRRRRVPARNDHLDLPGRARPAARACSPRPSRTGSAAWPWASPALRSCSRSRSRGCPARVILRLARARRRRPRGDRRRHARLHGDLGDARRGGGRAAHQPGDRRGGRVRASCSSSTRCRRRWSTATGKFSLQGLGMKLSGERRPTPDTSCSGSVPRPSCTSATRSPCSPSPPGSRTGATSTRLGELARTSHHRGCAERVPRRLRRRRPKAHRSRFRAPASTPSAPSVTFARRSGSARGPPARAEPAARCA